MKNKIVFLLLILMVLPLMGLGCKGTDTAVQLKTEPVTLEYWRVWDGPDAFSDIIAKYKELRPNVTIKYRKFTYEEYENQMLQAMAEDRGPDIFSLNNAWVRKYQNRIAPLPAQITMPYTILQGTIKKELVTQLRTDKSLTPNDIRNNFVDTIYSDVVLNTADENSKTTSDKIYALPLSIDSLALYYNRDLLNSAGIPTPPKYWNRDFQLDVKNLTKQNANGQIVQSGVAMGGSRNIERSTDILSLLMMQNGAPMMDDNGRLSFSPEASYSSSKSNPGLEALAFYIDYANPGKEVYSWNDTLDNSLEMFTSGRLAMMFGYAYHLPTIKSLAPKLNFGISPMFQIEGATPVNYANYWVETVSKKSANIDYAWDFLQFATKAGNVDSYLKSTEKPTALRSLVNSQLSDDNIGIFANQVLTAKSWYRGFDFNAVEGIFADLIDASIKSPDQLSRLLITAGQRIQQTTK
jgi:multiple sugar transport system substrate-binding protein